MMTATIYMARFGTPSAEFYTAALAWPAPSGPMLPANGWHILRSKTDMDISLRITGGKEPIVSLLLTADRKASLEALVNSFHETATITGLKQAHSAMEFDAMTDIAMSPRHLRTDYEGYHRDDQPLGCDFRLYSFWAGKGIADEVGYQITLRAHPTGREQERCVRKYLAWLDLEQPFTPAVRELQQILARRLLAPSWLADEYLLFPNAEIRGTWEKQIRTHFLETTGRIGFPEPPIAVGDFSDWLITGCHTVRDGEIPSSLPVEAACAFSEDEVLWLAQQNLSMSTPSTQDAHPVVFISYASADFAHADATRQYLENGGRRCWMAPRDINTGGLPYTEAIPRAIQQARAVVVLLSPTANFSVHIPRELDLALAQKLPIVPLRLKNLLPAGQLEYLLRTCQWLDVFERDHDEAMSELSRRLNSLGI